jgi:hypothetical protein
MEENSNGKEDRQFYGLTPSFLLDSFSSPFEVFGHAPQISALLWLTVFRHCFVLGLMQFRLKIRIAAWLVFSLLAGGWLAISHARKGPVVDGLTLDQWLNFAAYFEDGRYESVDSAEFRNAVRQFGTNAIPRLISRLYTRELPGIQMAYQVLGKDLFLRLGFGRSMIERERALLGFSALGSLATNAIPELLQPPRNGRFTARVFDSIGTSAFPHLVEQIRTGDSQVKSYAMSALEVRAFDFQRDEVVAVWMECLTDSSPSIRLYAARLIGNTRPMRAQKAIPALQAAINDRDAEVVAEAKAALTKLVSTAGYTL